MYLEEIHRWVAAAFDFIKFGCGRTRLAGPGRLPEVSSDLKKPIFQIPFNKEM